MARTGLVLAKGVFDLTHAGHVLTLVAARELGQALAVGICSDASTRLRKGPDRPLLPWNERATIVASLEAVDYVFPYEGEFPFATTLAVAPGYLLRPTSTIWPPNRSWH